MRIAIIGHSGAGKSTLAKALGARYCCPVLHLDILHHRAGWKTRPDEQALLILRPYLDNQNWVIDGNYSSLAYWERMEAADWIIFLDFSRLRCLRQAYGRYRQNKGHVRESMAPGCAEKFDFPFVRWILWQGRSRSHRRRYRQVADTYPGKLRICRNRQDVARLLREGLS